MGHDIRTAYAGPSSKKFRSKWLCILVLTALTQISIVGQTLFVFASGLSKLSILTSYLRIAPLGSTFQRVTQVTIGAVLALIIIFLMVLWTQCM